MNQIEILRHYKRQVDEYSFKTNVISQMISDLILNSKRPDEGITLLIKDYLVKENNYYREQRRFFCKKVDEQYEKIGDRE